MSRVTIPKIIDAKGKKKLSALTAYDYAVANLVDEAGADIILVGDSLGCVVQGHKNTLSVTVDEIVYHTRCARRGTKNALLVADLPFMSVQISEELALKNSARLIAEGGAAAVKVEGGTKMAGIIKLITNCDIPVMGHIGLTPQSYHKFGGHKRQGTKDSVINAKQLLLDAKGVEAAGAFAVVLECIPEEVAAKITKSINIPTIGIGSGNQCDGQIIVTYDLLGLSKAPAFVKDNQQMRELLLGSLDKFIKS